MTSSARNCHCNHALSNGAPCSISSNSFHRTSNQSGEQARSQAKLPQDTAAEGTPRYTQIARDEKDVIFHVTIRKILFASVAPYFNQFKWKVTCPHDCVLIFAAVWNRDAKRDARINANVEIVTPESGYVKILTRQQGGQPYPAVAGTTTPV